ncbi:hypothetical protein NAF17_07055 [Mucilaginibacter sp. RB4R14]|uniref:hypothetical protein n=1 Tax=Mucilaginibacter aurantiaciroseus TaxID=2949308 RepID=UPI0020910860|nr:hypothetical protein [Mucilaginibacter aurantiaciroseus]MCO5935293.1 hypothetical protein [Mucilaginibacter aurantiaciroseus]
MKSINYIFIIAILFLTACKKDPAAGVRSHERAIEAVSLGDGLVQVGPAVVDRANAKVIVRVLVQTGTAFDAVKPTIQTSYKATVSPASGNAINFASSNNEAKYTVTSETGETREWTVVIQPFNEALLGTFKIQDYTVYGGTGPQYGGGSVFNIATKSVWPAAGPAQEYDNTLTFTYTGVTADGNTQGTVVNSAGADGLYADFVYSKNPVTDVNAKYRVIPKGEGKWLHNYSNNTIVFTFPNGTSTTCTYDAAGTTALGNGLTKVITDNAFVFTLAGADDYGNIYSDFDKIVKRPYKLWVNVKKQ